MTSLSSGVIKLYASAVAFFIALALDARASLIKLVVIVLPLILGTIIGPSPPPPALTITGLLADVPKLEAAFWPAAS